MNKRETGLVGCAVRAVTALGLLLVSSLSVAQLNCNPSTPRTDPGAEFVAFGEREQLLARGGNAGPAWEWALGPDTDVDGQNVKASHDWVSGKVYSWTLSYAGTSASVELRDGGTLLFTRTFATGMDRGNALHFQVNTNPSIGPTTTIAATVTQIAGNAVAGSLSQTGNNQEAVQNLYFFFPGMAAGFTAQGTVTLTYASLPSGSRVDFRVRAGTISCTSTNAPPTVSITSPVNGENVQFPAAAILVTAQAQDADGTVTQVEFFANGALIGTATGPFSIQWANVAVGDYVLTARATDNAGVQTTSVGVNVSVRVPQVFFVHTDHLNTPRVITNQTQQVVWRWDQSDPFGGNVPDENPSGLGTFTCNLRLPGQYFDKETNLYYNYFRDYDPAIGRYVQSDPIGLQGGINTYAYVGSNPIRYADPLGLVEVDPSFYFGGGGGSGPYLQNFVKPGQQAAYIPTNEELLFASGILAAGIVAPAAGALVCEIPGAIATAATAPSAISIWLRIGGLFRPLPPNSALPPPVPPVPPAIIRQVPQTKPVPPNMTLPAAGGAAIGAGGMCPPQNQNICSR